MALCNLIGSVCPSIAKGREHAATALCSGISGIDAGNTCSGSGQVAFGGGQLAAVYRCQHAGRRPGDQHRHHGAGGAGYTSGFEEVPWARALLGVSEGRYDVLINAWYNDSRARIGQFSTAYLTNRIRLLQRKGEAFRYKSLSDLYPYSIAVVRDYAYSPEFDRDTRLHKVPVRNFSSAVRMLAAGRVNLAVEDEYVARYNLQRELPEVRDGVMLVEPPLGENTLHIWSA